MSSTSAALAFKADRFAAFGEFFLSNDLSLGHLAKLGSGIPQILLHPWFHRNEKTRLQGPRMSQNVPDVKIPKAPPSSNRPSVGIKSFSPGFFDSAIGLLWTDSLKSHEIAIFGHPLSWTYHLRLSIHLWPAWMVQDQKLFTLPSTWSKMK